MGVPTTAPSAGAVSVTGGMGTLGSRLVRLAAEQGWQVRATWWQRAPDGPAEWVRTDIRDAASDAARRSQPGRERSLSRGRRGGRRPHRPGRAAARRIRAADGWTQEDAARWWQMLDATESLDVDAPETACVAVA